MRCHTRQIHIMQQPTISIKTKFCGNCQSELYSFVSLARCKVRSESLPLCVPFCVNVP